MSVEFIKYIIFGAITFVLDVTILIALVDLFNCNYLISNTISVAFGICFGYFMSIKYIFGYRKFKNIKTEFSIFTLLCLIGIIINDSLLYFFVEVGGFHYIASKIMAAGMVFVANYLMKKRVLF